MSAVLIDISAPVAVLTLNRPDQGNSLNEAAIAQLIDGLEAAAADSAVRVVVLTGCGHIFCAGVDLKQAAANVPTVFTSAQGRHPLIRLYQIVATLPKPLIARVNGHAMGGGLGLVAMCDLAVGVTGAKFGTPEARVGLFPAMILGHLLRLVPERELRRMAMTGRPIPAARAVQAGLLNEAVPAAELDASVDGMINDILACGPEAMAAGCVALRAMHNQSIDQVWAQGEALIAELSQGQEAANGIAAFIDKRTPDWVTRR